MAGSFYETQNDEINSRGLSNINLKIWILYHDSDFSGCKPPVHFAPWAAFLLLPAGLHAIERCQFYLLRKIRGRGCVAVYKHSADDEHRVVRRGYLRLGGRKQCSRAEKTVFKRLLISAIQDALCWAILTDELFPYTAIGRTYSIKLNNILPGSSNGIR